MNLIIKIIKSISYRISRKLLMFSEPKEHPDFCIKSLINNLPINLILDIGANKGQFRNLIRSSGYKKLIISFEPLLDANNFLRQRSKKDNFWIIWDNIAIGDSLKRQKLFKTKNSVSSSILPPMGLKENEQINKKYNKGTEIVDSYEVKVATLDSLSKEIKKIAKSFYSDLFIHLKIDVEGYEVFVLNGAEKFLNQVSSISIEISLDPLNKDAFTYDYVIKYLESKGFMLWSIDRGFTSEIGKCYQIDTLFIRKNLVNNL